MAASGKCREEEKASEGGRPYPRFFFLMCEDISLSTHFPTGDRALPELQFTNSTAQEGRNTLCLETQGHCRHQGHVDGVLVLCHTVGEGGGCQSCYNASCCLLLHPVPWGKGAEPCQGWRPWGCHLPRTSSPIFHLWPLCSGHMLLSPAVPVYSGHQLLALSLVPRQTILSQRGNPEGANVGQRAGAGSQQDHPSQCEMCPGPLSCLRASSWANPTSPTSGRDPVPCERHRYSVSALSPPPCSSPTSQQQSSSCVPRDAQQGWPSPHIHNSISLTHLDDQTKPLPPHGCPLLARCQLQSPACGHRQ